MTSRAGVRGIRSRDLPAVQEVVQNPNRVSLLQERGSQHAAQIPGAPHDQDSSQTPSPGADDLGMPPMPAAGFRAKKYRRCYRRAQDRDEFDSLQSHIRERIPDHNLVFEFGFPQRAGIGKRMSQDRVVFTDSTEQQTPQFARGHGSPIPPVIVQQEAGVIGAGLDEPDRRLKAGVLGDDCGIMFHEGRCSRSKIAFNIPGQCLGITVPRLPAKFLLCLFRGNEPPLEISLSILDELDVRRLSEDRLQSAHHLQHRDLFLAVQVEDIVPGAFLQAGDISFG